jgi:cytosine/adenosine deaminase-related metal-dependent hydrolase
MSAMEVLEMATLNGAKALGLEGEVGSLEEGRLADLVTVDLSRAHAMPNGGDPVSTLVYAGQSRDVRDVVVDGRVLMRERRVLTLDEPKVLAEAARHAARLVAKLA